MSYRHVAARDVEGPGRNSSGLKEPNTFQWAIPDDSMVRVFIRIPERADGGSTLSSISTVRLMLYISLFASLG